MEVAADVELGSASAVEYWLAGQNLLTSALLLPHGRLMQIERR